LSREVDSLQDELKLGKNAAAEFQQKLKAAKEALASQFNQNERWVAQQALFTRAIQKIASASEKAESELTTKDLKTGTNELLDSEVSVQEQGPNGTIDVVNKKIGDILKLELPQDPSDFPNLVQKLSGLSFDARFSPGIAITILGLAADLADAEYRKEKIRLAILGRKLALLERLQKNLDESRRLATAAASDLALLPDEAVLTSLLRLRKATASAEDPAGPIAAELDALLRTAIPLTILSSERQRQEVELAALDHEYSIQLSSVNAQEHEALMGRGLEGLAAYHRGGLTPEEIANFIRAAQLAAMGVIGGRL
jgi:hypothetical protein